MRLKLLEYRLKQIPRKNIHVAMYVNGFKKSLYTD